MAFPTLNSISPATGPTAGGDVVRLTGTGFAPEVAVLFGDASAFRRSVESFFGQQDDVSERHWKEALAAVRAGSTDLEGMQRPSLPDSVGSRGRVKLKRVWEMLDACAPGWQRIETKRQRRYTMRSLLGLTVREALEVQHERTVEKYGRDSPYAKQLRWQMRAHDEGVLDALFRPARLGRPDLPVPDFPSPDEM